MFTKFGGNLGETNSVAWMFEKRGLVTIDKHKTDEEALMGAVLDAGADDMKDDGSAWEIVSSPSAHQAVVDAVKKLGVEPDTAQIAMLPQNYVKLEGRAGAADAEAHGAARGPRRHAQRLVEFRRRGTGNRGLAGVRIFGIDPGSLRTGYGCVETDGRRHHLVTLRRARRCPPKTAVPRQAQDHPRAA